MLEESTLSENCLRSSQVILGTAFESENQWESKDPLCAPVVFKELSFHMNLLGRMYLPEPYSTETFNCYLIEHNYLSKHFLYESLKTH